MSETVYSGTYTDGVTLNNPGTQRSVSVTSTGIITNATGDALLGLAVFPWAVTNSGTIHSTAATARGIQLLAGGSVTNQLTGLIEGDTGILIKFAPGSVTNIGTVKADGTYSTGISLLAGGSVVNGSKTATLATIAGGSNGVSIQEAIGTVTNFGTISEVAGNAVIALAAGGLIANGSSTSTTAEITGPGTGIYVRSGSATITNFGTIESTDGTALVLRSGAKVTNGKSGSTAGTIISAKTGVFIDGGTGTVSNFGTIQTTGSSTAVALESGGSVTNGASGSTKAVITGLSTGIYITGGLGTLTNFGTIASTNTAAGTAVVLRDGGNVANFGTIINSSTNSAGVYLEIKGTITNGTSTSHTALIKGAGTGVSVRAGRGTVINFGSITSTSASAIYLRAGGSVTNQAGGHITAISQVVEIAGDTGTVSNLGTIQATGADNSGVVLVDGGSVTNGSSSVHTALITGTAAGVYFRSNGATLTNFGTIKGAVAGFLGTGAGDHTVINYGTIASTAGASGVAVNMGNGNSGGHKLLIVEPGAVFVGSVIGSGRGEIDILGSGTAALANVSGFNTIRFGNGVAHAATLTNTNVDGLPSSILTVIGGSSGNTIDASAVTDGRIIFEAGAGTDSFTGSSGNDTFMFSAANLTSADKVDGGGGFDDELQMTSSGTIAVSGVSGVEIFRLADTAANTLTLTGANFTNLSGGMITIYDGNHNDTINGSAITGTGDQLVTYAGTGVEKLTGSAGNDTFIFQASTFTSSDIVAGGSGNDTLLFTTAGAPNITKVTAVENIVLADGGANTLTLTTANFTGVSGPITISDGDNGTTLSASGLSAAHSIIVYAGAGTDNLTGGAGNDWFYAGGSATTMTGGGGTDDFVFAGALGSKITDFTHLTDQFVVRDANFNLGSDEGHGTSTPQEIAASLLSSHTDGTFASTANRFAYNKSTGALYYDADGSGGASAKQLVATLTNHPATISAGDLFFIS